ncbi:MAG TPA: hypothetical protein VJN18_32255 [Polyangiaceae bacterium]|nr:hypothetical protein [Polyangiaceae bacterium]
MASAKQHPLELPPDAKAHVDALPPWLRDVAAQSFAATSNPTNVAKAERERAETDRLTRFNNLVDLIASALPTESRPSSLGRSREAQVGIEALRRVLGGKPPRECEAAVLATCESIIRETKERIRKANRPPPAGRGAP